MERVSPGSRLGPWRQWWSGLVWSVCLLTKKQGGRETQQHEMAHLNLMMIKKGVGFSGVGLGLGLSPPRPAAPCRTRIIIVNTTNITSSAGRGRVRVPLLRVRDRNRVSGGSHSMTGTEEAFATNSQKTQTNYKSSSSSPSEMGQEKEQEHDKDDVVLQYVVLRRDLIETWPLGSVVTQGCHASVSAIWSHKDDHHTVHYCSPSNIDSMHKVTLEVKGEPQILNLSQKLTAGGIAHKLWIEQPENIPTCLATKPYPKSVVAMFFRKLKLCK